MAYLIHVFPIPGVETANTEFFNMCHMSLVASTNEEMIKYLKKLLSDEKEYNKLVENQKKYIPSDSAKRLVDFIKDTYINKK